MSFAEFQQPSHVFGVTLTKGFIKVPFKLGGIPLTSSTAFAKGPGISLGGRQHEIWDVDNGWEWFRKAWKAELFFFLHLRVVQEKSAYCQGSPKGACYRYSHSEGSISCQTDCCNLVGSMSGIKLLSWIVGIQCGSPVLLVYFRFTALGAHGLKHLSAVPEAALRTKLVS